MPLTACAAPLRTLCFFWLLPGQQPFVGLSGPPKTGPLGESPAWVCRTMAPRLVDSAVNAINPEQIVVHDRPTDREGSNTILRADIPSVAGEAARYEQLWAAKEGPTEFRITCIPFATYGLAFGDHVEADEEGPLAFQVKRVTKRSGHLVIRAWLANANAEAWDKLNLVIDKHGLSHEFREPALVAIDIPPDDHGSQAEIEIAELAADAGFEIERGDEPFASAADI